MQKHAGKVRKCTIPMKGKNSNLHTNPSCSCPNMDIAYFIRLWKWLLMRFCQFPEPMYRKSSNKTVFVRWLEITQSYFSNENGLFQKKIISCLAFASVWINIESESYQLKVTQINYVSRNQLHNPSNGCQILNFGLSYSVGKG